MAEQKLTSERWTLNWLDLGKGLLVAMLTAFAATAGQVLENWLVSADFTFDKVSLILSVKAAIGAGLAYLAKNLITPQQIVTTVKVLLVTLCLTGMSGCSFIQQAQGYMEKHCPKSYVTDPFSGEITIHYQCDSLWSSPAVKEQCRAANICIDVRNGSLSGDVSCSTPILMSNLKTK